MRGLQHPVRQWHWMLLLIVSLGTIFSYKANALVDPDEPKLVVTGTTPHLLRRESNPFAKDKKIQAPYVHWTCYHGDDVQSKSVELHCCRMIYFMIQTDPAQLRWRSKYSVSSDYKYDKKDFMQYCGKNLQPVPRESKSKEKIAPRYTLFRVPEGNIGMKINMWTQIFGVSNLANVETEPPNVQWSGDDFSSPISLSKKARELFRTDDDDDNIGNSIKTFGGSLTSLFAADEDNDLERYLKHALNIHIGELDSTTKLEMNILLFLPEGVALGKKSRGLTACQRSGSADGSKCEVGTSSSLSTKTSLTQLDIVSVRLTATIAPGDEQDLQFSWMTQLVLEDDEMYMIPAPTIQGGRLESNTQAFEFDGNTKMAAPVVTDLDKAVWGDEL